MKRWKVSYGYVLENYFYDFVRGMDLRGILAIFYPLTLLFHGNLYGELNLMVGVPICFALVSGLTHSLTLPFLMYLAPFSHGQREEYLQKSLLVKIAVPVCFAFVWDAVLALVRPFPVYAFILQMATVFVISWICGALHDRGGSGEVWKCGYGDFAPFIAVSLAVCYLEGVLSLAICIGAVNALEFWLILGLMTPFTAPVLIGIGKHWREIRANFAEYELATNTKEAER